jgi:hypothetical protein
MKKLLLTFGLVGMFSATQAQIIFAVEAPASIAGGYDFNLSSNGWAFPNMSLASNAVLDTVELALDATAADSLACNAIVSNVTGKIAILHRGACEFGVKALNAQNAGAVAVIIINNIPGAPVAMGAGASGANVTIPAIMISQADGATLIARIEAGDDVVAFIGSKTGYYPNDLGFYSRHTLKAESSAIPSAMAQNGSEFSVQLGAWVFNYGQNDQTGITLSADVTLGANSLHNPTSSAFSLLAGDSVYITLPTFSQTSYTAGLYNLTYSLNYATTDDYDSDNEVSSDFLISTNTYAVAELDPAGLPVSASGIRPSTNNNSFSACVVFRNANADRMAPTGLTFSASTATNSGNTLDGEVISVTAYEWNDVFVDLDDAGLAISNLVTKATGEYSYDADDQSQFKFAPFDNSFVMDNDRRYLFCATTFNVNVFLGFDSNINYDLNEDTYLQPLMAIESDGTYSLGFTNPTYPAIVVHLTPAAAVGVEENNEVSITPFPNPSSTFVNIPMGEFSGEATLSITDITGKIVSTQKINAIDNNVLQVNISDLSNGVYVFNLNSENGKTSVFNVVVSK